MRTLPDDYASLFHSKSFAHFATLMADGTPHVAPVWIDYQDDHVLVNSAVGRLKDRNVRANPAVSLSVSDPENPYRTITVRGKVAEITEEGADAHIDALAKRYMGVDSYPHRTEAEVRVIYRIAIDKVATMG